MRSTTFHHGIGFTLPGFEKRTSHLIYTHDPLIYFTALYSLVGLFLLEDSEIFSDDAAYGAPSSAVIQGRTTTQYLQGTSKLPEASQWMQGMSLLETVREYGLFSYYYQLGYRYWEQPDLSR